MAGGQLGGGRAENLGYFCLSKNPSFRVSGAGAGVAGSQLEGGAPGFCLTAIMKAAHLDQLASSKPLLYEQVLGLFHALAAAPVTMEATLSLLRSSDLLLRQLDHVACSLLPSDVRTPSNDILNPSPITHHPDP